MARDSASTSLDKFVRLFVWTPSLSIREECEDSSIAFNPFPDDSAFTIGPGAAGLIKSDCCCGDKGSRNSGLTSAGPRDLSAIVS